MRRERLVATHDLERLEQRRPDRATGDGHPDRGLRLAELQVVADHHVLETST